MTVAAVLGTATSAGCGSGTAGDGDGSFGASSGVDSLGSDGPAPETGNGSDGATGGEADETAGVEGTGDSGASNTDEAGTGDGSTADDGADESDESDESDGDSTGGPVCETLLCGDPAQCCAADQDCVLGACVAACDSGVRCGDDLQTCCDDGQVCLGGSCETPTGDCVDSFDCELGEFCEPTLDRCLPQLDPVTCELVPDFEDIDVVEEWSWTDEEVISIPVIADLDGDGDSEVVLNLTHTVSDWIHGEVAVLDGRTGALQWRLADNAGAGTYGSHGRSTLGVSDVSGDDAPDIVYAGRANGQSRSLVIAVDHTGATLWTSHDPNGTDHRFRVVNGGVSFGNFDDDPNSEIVFGATLIDHDGTVVWDQGGNGAVYGTNSGYEGGISAVVDLTGDGYPEIVSGRHAWSVAWTVDGNGDPDVEVTQLWDAGGSDGYPAIADLDLDGDPEVVLTAAGNVRVLDGTTGLAWCGVDASGDMCDADPALRTPAVAIPGGGIGGPPTIADFDGDGRPEIAAAGGSSYTVYDVHRPGEDIVQPAGDAVPALGRVYRRWSQTTQDQSSNATGSSVFDFQGDGVAEVVYADECYLRVYSGLDGTVLLQLQNSSATIHEYPLVVDVDDDGNSEIVVVANDSNNDCGAQPNYSERRGVFVYGDEFDRWVGTRRVWTSHTYHVTNVTSVGNAPAQELDNWTQPGLNNYRQNVQGEGVFNAPDLSVELSADVGGCATEELEIIATVRNDGALGVPAGIAVSLYLGNDDSGTLVGTQNTADPLLPGEFVTLSWILPFEIGDPALSFYVAVDGVNEAAGTVAECDEANNEDATQSAECPPPS